MPFRRLSTVLKTTLRIPFLKPLRGIYVYYRLHRRYIIAGVFLIAHITGALSSVNAVMQNRTPQGAIAWAIPLNLFPFVAVPAYWIFGHSEFEGYVVARRSSSNLFKGIRTQIVSSVEENQLLTKPTDPFDLSIQRLAGMSYTNGNDARLLIDGRAAFDAMYQAIDAAEDYILFQFYIVRDDPTGRRFQEKLIAKAKQGVDVYFLYDEIGSLGLSDEYIGQLAAAGVNIRSFTTKERGGRKYQINFRNHRKILVVDGEIGFTGGFNIGEEYLGKDIEWDSWRDTHMSVVGPAVTFLQIPFCEDWYWEAGMILEDLNWQPKEAASGVSKAVVCIPTGPADSFDTCSLFYLSAINNAKDRLWISTPYFVPDRQILSALQLADLRGVDVRIIVPKKSDSLLVGHSSYSFLDEAEAAGIETYRYTAGFTHQKVMLIDDDFSCIGSPNMDNRSFRLNFEIALGIRDKGFAEQVAKMLEDDLANSEEVHADYFEELPYWRRLASRIASLFSPIL